MAAPAGSKTTTKSTTTTTKTGGSAANDPNVKAAKAKAIADAKAYAAMVRQFVPQSQAEMMRSVQSLYPDYSGNILTDAMLRKNAGLDVRSIMNPQLQNIANIYKARGQSGASAITGLTDIYTGRVKNWADQIHASNTADLQQQAGLSAALANFTRDRTAQLQGDLTGSLQTMGASQQLTDQTAGVNQKLGDQASLGVAALGTSTDQRMLAENNAMNNYADLQPGFAAAQGQQQMGQFQAGLNNAMQTDLSTITSKMPELIQQVYGNLLNNNNAQRTLKANRGQTLVGAYGDAQTNALNSRIAGATVAENVARLSGQSASDWLTAITNGQSTTQTTTTDAGDPSLTADQRLAGAQKDYMADVRALGAKSKFLDAAGKPTDFAIGQPKLVMQQIETALRHRATGKIPPGLLHQYAIDVMQQLGLPRTLPPGWKKGGPTGPTGPVGQSDSGGFDFGSFLDPFLQGIGGVYTNTGLFG